MRVAGWLLPFVIACGAAQSGPRTDGRGVAPSTPSATATEPPPAVDVYTTRPAPNGVRGGADAVKIEQALVDLTRDWPLSLAPDGRLADLGTFVAETSDQAGNGPSSSTLDAFARRLGLVEPVPLIMTFTASKGAALREALDDLLRGAPHKTPYNRYGIAVVPRFGQRLAVVVMSASSAEIDPVPRRTVPGSTLPLHGRLRDHYKHPQVEVALPSGSVTRVGERAGRDFDFRVPISQRGVHRVELLADGPFGPEVLANFPIFASVDEPPISFSPSPAAAKAVDLGDEVAVAAKLFALLNDARKTAGIAPLKEHPGLAEVGRAHSRDMVASGFFGHVSPTNGDVGMRVRRSGLGFVLVSENLGRGSTPEEVNTMLLDSPGHRANALDANLDYVGIGVVVDRTGGRAAIVATEEFAAVSKPIDLAAAPSQLLRIVNARRAAAGAPAFEIDPALSEAARNGVALYFKDPARDKESIVEQVGGDLTRAKGTRPSPIARKMKSALTILQPVMTLDHATKIEQLFDPTARYLGIGIAQGTRPETGPNTIGVLVIVGWPR